MGSSPTGPTTFDLTECRQIPPKSTSVRAIVSRLVSRRRTLEPNTTRGGLVSRAGPRGMNKAAMRGQPTSGTSSGDCRSSPRRGAEPRAAPGQSGSVSRSAVAVVQWPRAEIFTATYRPLRLPRDSSPPTEPALPLVQSRSHDSAAPRAANPPWPSARLTHRMRSEGAPVPPRRRDGDQPWAEGISREPLQADRPTAPVPDIQVGTRSSPQLA